MTAPIRRLLVANRGEIARRIFRTATQMGITTIAVYAPSDAGAPHVAEADVAVALVGSAAAETYLDADQLLSAAAATGADALHPGYGFLSERAGFASAVIGAGLTWVGPPPAAIAAMGDKLAAKDLMGAAGVPILISHRVSGDRLPELDAGEYPMLVKASAGGGGKGMRIVSSPEGLAEAVAAAQREAGRSFGDPTVFVERYLADARHIEVQILADTHGHVVHLFERECSIQRRHQKIIEEAPAARITPEVREQITEAALDAARAVGYTNAGTVEFVVDATPTSDGGFYFLEVNTRLQVEHPVTEAVTGLDLVRQQLLVAEGRPLAFTQADVQLTGHAVEARLYAEDPAAGFLPATGTIVEWAPAASPAVRFDSGVGTGTVVGVEWDPMLAKVVAHAPTRTEAALALALALDHLRIRGVTTNRDYLVAVLRSAEFLAGDTTTSFVERVTLPLRLEVSDATLEHASLAATLAARAERLAASPVLRSLPPGWRNTVMPPEQAAYALAADPSRTVTVAYRTRRDGSCEVTWPDGRAAVVVADRYRHGHDRPGPDGPDRSRHGHDRRLHDRLGNDRPGDGPHGQVLRLTVDGRTSTFHVLSAGRRVWVHGPAGDVELAALPRFPERPAEEIVGALSAPMPGRVLSVHVAAGDAVSGGDTLVVVEAMKMEHRVTAPHDGTVTSVAVAAGDQVSAGDQLVVVAEPS